MTCAAEEGCKGKLYAKGLCRLHYDAERKHGRSGMRHAPKFRSGRVSGEPWVEMLASILNGSVRLDGVCKDLDSRIWDGDSDSDIERAIEICETRCRVYEQCRDWALGPESGNLLGVVGGEYFADDAHRHAGREVVS